jgi:hypothetical protein
LRRSCLALAVLVLMATPPAWAQYSAIIAACRMDATGVCGGATPEGGRLAACITQNFQSLSEPCKAALVQVSAVRAACAADVRQQCPATRPGAGRLLFCVKAHYPALSAACRDAIGQAAARHIH